MKKYYRLASVLLALIMLLTCCSSDISEKGQTSGTDLIQDSLSNETITICFMGYSTNGQPDNVSSIIEMLAELNKKTTKELRTEIKLQWLPFETFDADLTALLESGSTPDAFATYKVYDYSKKALLKDITELFPQSAPHYYSLLDDSWKNDARRNIIDGKLYSILNNELRPQQDFVAARRDLVEKYAPGGITDFESYAGFMQAVKDNEPLIVPCYFSAYTFLDAYMKGKGYFSQFASGLYSNWSSDSIFPVAAEDTDVFNGACSLYKQWIDNGLLLKDVNTSFSDTIYDGNLASILFPGYQIHMINNYLLFPSSYEYMAYPLYPDKERLQYRSANSLAVNAKSGNSDRIIAFIEWLQSGQENYDLFMYGIKDKNYGLKGNKLDFKGLDNNSIITGWWGSEVFSNYLYERALPYEPDNYKEFLEKSCYENAKTIDELYADYGYDIEKFYNMSDIEKEEYEAENEKIQELENRRNAVYQEFIAQLEAGNLDKTLGDMIKEQGQTENTEKLIEMYKTEFEMLKK